MDVLAHGQAGTSRLLAADCFPRSNPQAHRAVEGGYSGRDRSTFESISMRPSSRKRLNPVHRESAYRIASAMCSSGRPGRASRAARARTRGQRSAALLPDRATLRRPGLQPRISLSIRYRPAMRIERLAGDGAPGRRRRARRSVANMRPAEGQAHLAALRHDLVAAIAVDLQHAPEARQMRDRHREHALPVLLRPAARQGPHPSLG